MTQGIPYPDKKIQELEKRIKQGFTYRQISKRMVLSETTIKEMVSLGYRGIDRYEGLVEAKLKAPENRGRLNGSVQNDVSK